MAFLNSFVVIVPEPSESNSEKIYHIFLPEELMILLSFAMISLSQFAFVADWTVVT